MYCAPPIAFVDDIKLFYLIDSLSDCRILQNVLKDLVFWASNLGLQFNIAKYHYMTITPSRSPVIILLYAINVLILLSLDTSVNDLGFVFVPMLSPNLHMERAWC